MAFSALLASLCVLSPVEYTIGRPTKRRKHPLVPHSLPFVTSDLQFYIWEICRTAESPLYSISIPVGESWLSAENEVTETSLGVIRAGNLKKRKAVVLKNGSEIMNALNVVRLAKLVARLGAITQ